MPKVTIKEVKHSENFVRPKTQGGLTVLDGFKFGFGMFVAFLAGFLILCTLSYVFWKFAELL